MINLKLRFSASVALVMSWTSVNLVSAYLRMSCDPVTLQVRDPIMGPGQSVFGHTHVVAGAPLFDATTEYADLRATKCSSCGFDDDKSLYWAPYLYFYNTETKQYIGADPSGTGFDIYYHWLGADVTAIKPMPTDLRMVAGNAEATAKPKNNQIFFQCPSDTTGAKYNQFPMEYCDFGQIKATVIFPSCWDGVNSPTKPSATHVAYPDVGNESYEFNTAECPKGFDTQLPTLFVEIWYGIKDFEEMWTSGKGYPVLAQGDPNGYGLHADFIMGWEESTFEEVVSSCAGEVAPMYTGNGNVEDCPPLKSGMYPSADAAAAGPNPSCKATLTYSELIGTMTALPNGNTQRARVISSAGLTQSSFGPAAT